MPSPFSEWFAARGWTPRSHQLELIARAEAKRSVLLVAPTGGGKTLAGFLPSLIELAGRKIPSDPPLKREGRIADRRSGEGSPTRNAPRIGADPHPVPPPFRGRARDGSGLHTLYISPLKALAVDVARNLETPIKEMGLSVTPRDPHGRHIGP